MTDKDATVDVTVNEPEQAAAPVINPNHLAPRLSDGDMLALERAGNKRALADAHAKQAIAESENAELQYKNVVMQLFLKYGLSDKGSFAQDGTITRAKV